jgi:hypothetical protein
MIERGSIPEGEETTPQDVYENRYQRIYLWVRQPTYPGSLAYSFTPTGQPREGWAVVLAAVGWRLETDRDRGVVLRSVMGRRLDASEVALAALRDEDGLHLGREFVRTDLHDGQSERLLMLEY